MNGSYKNIFLKQESRKFIPRKQNNSNKLNEKIETSDKILILACGALAREISILIRINSWNHIHARYLPAKLHNNPEKITDQLRTKLQSAKKVFPRIFIGYADCGTGGKIDSLLEEFKIQRLPGAHCYEFFTEKNKFEKIMEEEIGSFFLTDFLVKAFEKLVWKGMKIDRYPELKEIYFKNYKKLVYLSQEKNSNLEPQAIEIAELLGLEYVYRYTGYGELEKSLSMLDEKL